MSAAQKKVAIIGTNGLPGRYGGWDQLMNHLTIQLRHKFNFLVYTSVFDAEKGLDEVNGAKIEIVHLKANGVQSVIYDGWSLFHAVVVRRCDVVLVLGTSGCIFFPFARIFKSRIVLNPDGAEWKRAKWGTFAKKFLYFSEVIGVRLAHEVIADNACIVSFLKDTHGVSSHLVAYGGDHVQREALSAETAEKYGVVADQYAFKVCRIEPENNIDMVLESFAQTEVPLVLIGNWNFSQYGKTVRQKYSVYPNLKLLDPIYDQARLDELRGNCGLYVHGHSVGGTNPSLVEAMNLGLCCIVFDVDYNRETTEGKALYFSSAQTLSEQVNRVHAADFDRSKVREAMKEIALRRYTWDEVVSGYSSILDGDCDPAR